MVNPNRRELLKSFALAAGAGISSRIFLREASAQTRARPFCLYIHCGSWDGIGSGLLQPNNTNGWPRGVFVPGEDFTPGTPSNIYSGKDKSVLFPTGNPLLNEIILTNNHYLSHYARPLKDISNNLLHITCAPGSLDHNVARVIQQTGQNIGQPHWVAGLAQVNRQAEDSSSLVINCPFLSGRTADISNVDAMSLSAFRNQFTESVKTNTISPGAAEVFISAAAEIFDHHAGPSVVPSSYKTTFKGSLSSIISGIPGLSAQEKSVLSSQEALRDSKLRGYIDNVFGNNDSEGIKSAPSSSALREQLILAGSLAAASAAYGMVIQMPNEDRHFGGSDVDTARMAGNLWAQVSLFWQWLVSEGIQNRVTIIITHEFTRTPWNSSFSSHDVVINGQRTTIRSPGRDHHPVNGLYVINAKLKSGGRYGGIIEGFGAAGSRELSSSPVQQIPAPTTQQALGTLFMSLFDEFKHPGQPDSARRVRGIWPTFNDSDLVSPLRLIV